MTDRLIVQTETEVPFGLIAGVARGFQERYPEADRWVQVLGPDGRKLTVFCQEEVEA